MSKDNKVVVWVGCDNPKLRDEITGTINSSLELMAPFGGPGDITIITVESGELNAPSLMDVMRDYDPKFFKEFDKKDKDQLSQLNHVVQVAKTQQQELETLRTDPLSNVKVLAKEIGIQVANEYMANMANITDPSAACTAFKELYPTVDAREAALAQSMDPEANRIGLLKLIEEARVRATTSNNEFVRTFTDSMAAYYDGKDVK